MKLSDCITDYLNYVKHEKGLAKTTCKQYASWLHHFTDWLNANGYPDADLDVFNVTVLLRFQYFKSKQGRRPRAIHSAFHPLRRLGEFLTDCNARCFGRDAG